MSDKFDGFGSDIRVIAALENLLKVADAVAAERSDRIQTILLTLNLTTGSVLLSNGCFCKLCVRNMEGALKKVFKGEPPTAKHLIARKAVH